MYRRGIGWDKENGVERDRRQSGLIKRHKEIKMDRQEIEKNTGGYTKDRLR